MFAWQFSKALHLARQHGWTPFVSMQNLYNLLYREEEREMLPLVPRRRHRRVAMEPARPRALDAPWQHGNGADRDRSPTATSSSTATEEADRKVVEQVGAVADGPRRAEGPSRTRLDCCRSPASPRPSSAPPNLSISTTPSPP